MFPILDVSEGLRNLLKGSRRLRRWVMSVGGVTVLAAGVAYVIPREYLDSNFADFTDRATPILAVIGAILLSLGLSSFASSGAHNLDKELEPIRAERERIRGESGGVAEADVYRRLELNLNQITEYYTINKSQARNSFRFGVFAVSAGMVTLIISVAVYLSDKSGRLTPAAITGISGVLTEFIGVSGLYLYNKSLGLLNVFYDRLSELQEVMLSIFLCDQITDEARKDETRIELIRSLFRSRP